VAYDFDHGTSFERIHTDDASSPIAGYPFTVSLWYKQDTSHNWPTLFGIWNSSDGTGDHHFLFAQGDESTSPVDGIVFGTETNYVATNQASIGDWHHILVSSSGASSHRLVLDGSVTTSSTNFGTFPDNATCCIGGNDIWIEETMAGSIAEVGIWNAAHLTPGEESALAAGVSPALVRSQSLVSYLPLVRGIGDERWADATWQLDETPTVVPHAPGIIYPTHPESGVIGVGDRTLYEWAARDTNPGTATVDLRNNHAVVEFDDGAEEYIELTGVMPRKADLDYLGLKLVWTASTNQGAMIWQAKFERHQDDTTDLDSDSWGNSSSVISAPSNSSGVVQSAFLRVGSSIDSIAAGESFRIRLSRDPQHAIDSMSGDAQLLQAELVEVSSG